MRLREIAQAGVVLAMLGLGGPAAAAPADFLGIWANGNADNSGIARLVVSPVTGGQVNIQLFGACVPAACDWGTHPARLYADDPASADIRTLAADFESGGSRKHLVLHLAVGGALRFDVLTDFAANAGRSNFSTSGNLIRSGDWRAAMQVAAAPPPGAMPVSPAPSAPNASAPPPSPPPSSSGWLGNLGGGSSFAGIGAATPAGYVPSTWEECTPFNLDQTRAANVDGTWRISDFAHKLLSFGSSRQVAQRALATLAFYHFDEQCFVTQARVAMLYWKRAGIVPNTPMPGEDCDAVDPGSVKAVRTGGGWEVVAGAKPLFAFDDDKAAADRVVSVIRTYKLGRQCFFSRGSPRAQYWLSQ